MDPVEYENWYQTSRGKWVSNHEFKLMTAMLNPQPGESLLDVGCGTGHFTRQFAEISIEVTGIDLVTSMLNFARQQPGPIDYLKGDAQYLPFINNSFDYCAAVTSLCFISDPVQALSKMWRVSRKGFLLGLLNRYSLLYYQKHDQGVYQRARWDTSSSVKQ